MKDEEIEEKVEVRTFHRRSGKWSLMKEKMKQTIDNLKCDSYVLMTLDQYKETITLSRKSEQERFEKIEKKEIVEELAKIPKGWQTYAKYCKRFGKGRLIKFIIREMKKIEKLEEKLERKEERIERLEKVAIERDKHIIKIEEEIRKKLKEVKQK